MKFVLPRVISGNRGDLASRWGLLRTLHDLGVKDVLTFSRFPEDVPALPYRRLPYGKVRNLALPPQSWQAIRTADVVLWAVGLDLQDDSSLAKLMYLWVLFRLYRAMGLRTWCLFQGAGPVQTRMGKLLTRGILGSVDTFVARDPGTLRLVRQLSPATRLLLGHDAIFLPGFEQDLAAPCINLPGQLASVLPPSQRPVIGLNLRQWFHFSSSLLPYELARKKYQQRSSDQMKSLVASMSEVVRMLRQQYDAKVLLVSAYQPGVVPWEDDLPWLRELQQGFRADGDVVLMDEALSMPDYYRLMQRLDLMIGMRLHSSLIALRFGTPGANISYTVKGRDIYQHLGIAENVVDLRQFMQSPQELLSTAAGLLENHPAERSRVTETVGRAVARNRALLSDLLGGSQGGA